MNLRLLAVLSAALLLSATASADPPSIGVTASTSPAGSVSLSVTSTSANVGLADNGGYYQTVEVCNVGSAEAFLAWGGSTAVATTASGLSVMPIECLPFNFPTVVAPPYYLAARTASGSTTLRISQWNAMPAIALGGTGSGGGGGSVTQGTNPWLDSIVASLAFAPSSTTGSTAAADNDLAGCLVETTTPSAGNGLQVPVRCDPGGMVATTPYPSVSPNSAISLISSTAAESNHVLKNAAGNLFSLYATSTSATWYVFVLNRTSLPSNGAVTIGAGEAVYGPFAAGAQVNVGGAPPAYFPTGITVGCSSTGPYSLTAAATCSFTGQVL